MSTCNYCNWQAMKARGCRIASYAERKKLWDKEADKEGFSASFGGGEVVVNKQGEFAAWFMELPDHCCC